MLYGKGAQVGNYANPLFKQHFVYVLLKDHYMVLRFWPVATGVPGSLWLLRIIGVSGYSLKQKCSEVYVRCIFV